MSDKKYQIIELSGLDTISELYRIEMFKGIDKAYRNRLVALNGQILMVS